MRRTYTGAPRRRAAKANGRPRAAKGSYSGDLEFHVDTHNGTRTFGRLDEAAGLAVSLAASDGRPHDIDVVVWTAKGARKYGGDAAVAQYRDDPEASVFERITVRADSRGRIA